MLAIYTRISQDRNNQVSTEVQFEQGKLLAAKLQITYKQYLDKSVSGTSDIDKRPSLYELIQDIESGIITKVYAYDQSRLERQPEVRFALLKIFEKHNIELYYESGLVSNDTETELIGNLMSVVNNYFVKLTKKKIKLALNHNAEKGKVHALPPYAYYKDSNKQYAINYEQAEVIKEIYAMSLQGIGTNKIAEILNQRGIPTKYNLIGKGTLNTTNRKHKLKPLVTKNKADIKWTGNSVRGILYNKFYCGIRVFNGVEYEVPKIFEYDYWKKVNDNLKNNRNNSGKVVTHKYLLKGVLSCGRCGRNYYGRSRVSLKDNAYICSSKRYKELNCGNRGVNIPVLDKLIWFYIENNEIQHVINYIKENSTDNTINEKELLKSQLNNELKQIKKQYDNLISLVENGVLSAIDIKERIKINKDLKKDIEIKLFNIESEIAILNNVYILENEIPTEIDFNSKKEIINNAISNIEVLFDSNLYYIRIYPTLNNIKNNIAYIEYVFSVNYKYKVTNISYTDNLFKSVRFYNSILSNLKSLNSL